MYPDDSLLKKALGANAAFSGLSALVLAVAADPVARSLGSVSPIVLYVVADVLALFTLDLVHQLRSDELNPVRAFGTTTGDVLWVAGSAVLLVVRPGALSGTGLGIVAAVALIVLAMVVVQLAGLRRYARNQRGETDERSMFSLVRRLDAPPDRVWALLRSLDRIGEFYGELESVEVEEWEACTVRTCVDRKGQRWSEEVLEMDDEARSLSLRFVTEADDFPFPMTSMIGGWEVTPRGEGGSELTLWYECTLEGGILGEIMAALMAPVLDARMTPVMRNLEERAAGGERPPEKSAADGPERARLSSDPSSSGEDHSVPSPIHPGSEAEARRRREFRRPRGDHPCYSRPAPDSWRRVTPPAPPGRDGRRAGGTEC